MLEVLESRSERQVRVAVRAAPGRPAKNARVHILMAQAAVGVRDAFVLEGWRALGQQLGHAPKHPASFVRRARGQVAGLAVLLPMGATELEARARPMREPLARIGEQDVVMAGRAVLGPRPRKGKVTVSVCMARNAGSLGPAKANHLGARLNRQVAGLAVLFTMGSGQGQAERAVSSTVEQVRLKGGLAVATDAVLVGRELPGVDVFMTSGAVRAKAPAEALLEGPHTVVAGAALEAVMGRVKPEPRGPMHSLIETLGRRRKATKGRTMAA